MHAMHTHIARTLAYAWAQHVCTWTMNTHTQRRARICNYAQMSVHTYTQMHKSAMQNITPTVDLTKWQLTAIVFLGLAQKT